MRTRLQPGTRILARLTLQPSDDDQLQMYLRLGERQIELGSCRGFPEHSELQLTDGWAAIAHLRQQRAEVLLVALERGQVVLRAVLEGCSRVGLRLSERMLTIYDDAGRVRSLSLLDGAMLMDQRVSP